MALPGISSDLDLIPAGLVGPAHVDHVGAKHTPDTVHVILPQNHTTFCALKTHAPTAFSIRNHRKCEVQR